MTASVLAQVVRCTGLDYAVVAVYLTAILGVGLYFSRFSRSTREFFFGGQRFSAWLLAFSLMATLVGSYSFVKYSDVGFRYGLSSSMTYLNDWFYVPLLIFIWLPVIYFGRVRSVPEYFQRRFDGRARLMCAGLLMLYMLSYVGYTIFTLGRVAETLFDVPLFPACAVIALITGVYITIGGQTAVIFTDLVQSLMLIIAGVTIVVLGLLFLGRGDGLIAGISNFWAYSPLETRLPFAGFNKPDDFNFAGVFWQDMANSCVFFFINQGLIMRFLAAKSLPESRRVMLIQSFVLLPFAVLIVGGAGWVGGAIARMAPDQLDPNTPGSDAFVVIASLLCRPGVFGFVIAALIAALMSTVDTLINALAAITIIDVYQPYLARGRSDAHYLKAARVVSIIATVTGLMMVTLFAQFKSIYVAHAAFTAAITPPLAVSVILGVLWKRYTASAAFWSMFIGVAAAVVSIVYPEIVRPFMDLHGMGPEAKPAYMRALFLLTVCGVGGVIVTLFTRPKPVAEIEGLWIGSIERGRELFKGGRPNDRPGRKIVTLLKPVDDLIEAERPAVSGDDRPAYPMVRLSAGQMAELSADPGDILYIADARRRLGGLRSLHAVAGEPHAEDDAVHLSRGAIVDGRFLPDRPVRVEKII